MTDFIPIVKPNLPSGKVCHAVLSSGYPEFTKPLTSIGVVPLFSSVCSDVLPQISNHTDMLFSYLGNGKYIAEKSQQTLICSLDSLGFKSEHNAVSLSENYPEDVILNTLILGDKIFGTADVRDFWHFDTREYVSVRQGYAKCSVCVVDENSLITDDISMYSICQKLGYDVLLVRKGSVKLNGFDYGFIGGCSGKISHDTLAFSGDLKTHCDCQKIISFLKERHIDYISLCSGELIDIGSIIPITQYS